MSCKVPLWRLGRREQRAGGGHDRQRRNAIDLASAAVLASLLAVCGCSATVDVRSVATPDPTRSAYELRGPKLAQLQVEVTRLCPQGAVVLRQWQRYQHADTSVDPTLGWFGSTPSWFSDAEPGAQLAVVCTG